MSKNQKLINIPFCSHTKKSKVYNTNNIKYTYCIQCGCLSLEQDKHFYDTIKTKQKQKPVDINPIITMNTMKKRQDSIYPNLDNAYNLNENDSIENIKKIKDAIFKYLIKRKKLLSYLQNITRTLNLSDLSFYHCLFLVDLYLSHNITEEMTEEDLLYILAGFFLLSSKFKETDIYEPDLEGFNNIGSEITLSPEKIVLTEMKCLKIINFNFFMYSIYDWLNVLISNGYIFEGEIENKDYINEIQTFTFKLLILLTPKNFFIKYSPLYLAVALIEISREEKIDKNKINTKLFTKLLVLYNINFEIYKKCYKELKKLIINEDSNPKNENNLNQTPKKNNENKEEFENYNPRREYRSVQKEKIFKTNIISKRSEKLIDISRQNRLKLKQKLKEARMKIQLFNSTDSVNPKKDFNSVISSNNTTIKKSKNRISNFNLNKKNIEIIEYLNDSLPNIYKNNNDLNKAFLTEGQTLSGRNFKVVKAKNDILNNFSIKNKIIKKRDGTSADNQNLKNYNINYNTSNNTKKNSPLKLNMLFRTGTNYTLENNDKVNVNYVYNFNKNIAFTENNSIYINKNYENNVKYTEPGNNININIKENNNNNNINNQNQVNFIIKNYIGNNIKINQKNNINIFKNYSNVYNNNNKYFLRETPSEYIGDNELHSLRTNQPTNQNNPKEIGGMFLKRMESLKKKGNVENINQINEKEKEREINILLNRNNNKKAFITNLRNEKFNSNFLNELLSLKKPVFKNKKLPKLKLDNK